MPDHLKPDDREALFNALLDAFPTVGDLARMASYGMDVRLDVVTTGNLADRVQQLIEWAESKGRVQELIRAARRPSAQMLGAKGPASRLSHAPEDFDLEFQDKKLREALTECGFGEKPLLILLLRGVDGAVRRAFVHRVERELTDKLAPHRQDVTLNAAINSTAEVIEGVNRLKAMTARRHVLCNVVVEAAHTEVVDGFVQGLRQRLPGTFQRHIVVVVSVTEMAVVPEHVVEIPAPFFDDLQLKDWIRSATKEKGWPTELVREFAEALLCASKLGDTISIGLMYEALL